MTDCCGNCRFWQDIQNGEIDIGYCRRFPPTRSEEPITGGFYMEVVAEEWCGEYQTNRLPSLEDIVKDSLSDNPVLPQNTVDVDCDNERRDRVYNLLEPKLHQICGKHFIVRGRVEFQELLVHAIQAGIESTRVE